MKKLTASDIKDLREYERERDGFRAEIIAMKKRRRFELGGHMSVVFENASTMRFQVQEMARAERMLRDDQIATELATYNQLIPDAGELSATLFIQIEDTAELRVWLPRLVGIQDHVAIEVAGSMVRAHSDDAERLTRDDITASVHYLKFTFTPEQQQAFGPGPVRLVVDHPEYAADVMLTNEQRAELAGDFTA